MPKRTHGLSKTSEYQSWIHMIKRCTKPNNRWDRYGGRGIKVCERWMNDFLLFLEDVGKKPSPKLTLERIDNDKDYEPGNVRWATRWEQSLNRGLRSDNLSGYQGIYRYAHGKYEGRLYIGGVCLRTGRCDTLKEAIKKRSELKQKYHCIK